MPATRKSTRTAKPSAKAAATQAAAAPKRGRKAAPQPEPEKEHEDSDLDQESEEQDEEDQAAKVEEEDEEDEEAEQEEEEEDEEEDDEEVTFKIHTPKQPLEPRPVVAALSAQSEEDSDDDSDAAPEAVSTSIAKTKVLSAQDKEKEFLAKVQGDQKAKRREREQKLKEQQAAKAERTKSSKSTTPSATSEESKEPSKTTRSGLPALLPQSMLETVASIKNTGAAAGPQTGEKRKTHMRPEDFALLELELEMRKEAMRKKQAEKTERNVGPVTVKVLQKASMAAGQAVPETIVDFRQKHFYGNKIARRDTILNISQRNGGAATKFNRAKAVSRS